MSYESFAEVYDRLTENVPYKDIAAFIHDIIIKHKPDCSLVLDMACGTGTLALELARLGFDMTAVDSSPEMLCQAVSKNTEGVLFLCQSMEKLDMYGTMGAIVCTLDSINHVTDEDAVREIFRRAAMFLDDDGVFIFDVNTPSKHRDILAGNVFVYDLDEVFCTWQNETRSLDSGDFMTDISLEFFILDEETGEYYRSSESFSERSYSDELLRDILTAARLEIADVFDDYTTKPTDNSTQRAVYVCRKQLDNHDN